MDEKEINFYPHGEHKIPSQYYKHLTGAYRSRLLAIIERGTIKVNGKTEEIATYFHKYNPTSLTMFCHHNNKMCLYIEFYIDIDFHFYPTSILDTFHETNMSCQVRFKPYWPEHQSYQQRLVTACERWINDH
jgi:hypothetical protein